MTKITLFSDEKDQATSKDLLYLSAFSGIRARGPGEVEMRFAGTPEQAEAALNALSYGPSEYRIER